MNNFMISLKRFFANKNTVTVLGVLVGIAILYFAYNIRINQATKPINVPYAKVTIQPRTKITEDKIGYIQVPQSMLKGKVLRNYNQIINKYANYNTVIPEGSLFYTSTVVDKGELPGVYLFEIPEKYTAFNFPVDIKTSYGNSILPENYIDIYFKAVDDNGKVIVGKLVSNVKVSVVIDSKGQPVFENSDENRIASSIIFAVPEEIHLLLRKATYLKSYQAELIPVPTGAVFESDTNVIQLTSSYLKAFINEKTADVPLDQLPDTTTTTGNQ